MKWKKGWKKLLYFMHDESDNSINAMGHAKNNDDSDQTEFYFGMKTQCGNIFLKMKEIERKIKKTKKYNIWIKETK